MIDFKQIKKAPSVIEIQGSTEREKFIISTDTRHYKSGELFVALKGANFDGADFIEEVIDNGCDIIAISNGEKERRIAEKLKVERKNVCIIFVEDTIHFLQDLALIYRNDWMASSDKRKLIIGITGSNGKTTTKEMLYHFLNRIVPGKVICTEKNLNNHLGVPKTIFRLNENIDYLVLEMGTNHPGEIKVLCDTAKPNAGMLTNIGEAHLEFFHTTSNIFLEKRVLFDSVMEETKNNGFFIINSDDSFLRMLPKTPNTIHYTFKDDQNPDSVKCIYSGPKVEVNYRGQSYVLQNSNITGEHNFRNLAATFLMALSLFPDKSSELVQVASDFSPKDNRSLWMKWKEVNIFMDAYNANPSSMEVAIKGFHEFCEGKKVAPNKRYYVVGDMNELGEHAKEGHKKIGKLFRELGIKNVIFVGRYAQFFREGFGENCLYKNSTSELKQGEWPEILKQASHVFVKGSRSLQLESLTDIKIV